MKTDHEIRQNIMRRVRTLYILRQITNPALRGGVLAGGLFVLTQIVSVRDVVLNALGAQSVASLYNFAYSAVVTTEYSVLLLTTITLFLIGWFIFDQIQSSVTPNVV